MCLADFVPGEIITVLPCACGHKYHRTCIAVWLGRKNSCPLCCTQVRGTERSGSGIEYFWLYSFYHFTTSDMCSHCATLSWSSRRAMQRQVPTPQQEEKHPCLRKGEAVSHIHTHTYQRRGLTKTILTTRQSCYGPSLRARTPLRAFTSILKELLSLAESNTHPYFHFATTRCAVSHE